MTPSASVTSLTIRSASFITTAEHPSSPITPMPRARLFEHHGIVCPVSDGNDLFRAELLDDPRLFLAALILSDLDDAEAYGTSLIINISITVCRYYENFYITRDLLHDILHAFFQFPVERARTVVINHQVLYVKVSPQPGIETLIIMTSSLFFCVIVPYIRGFTYRFSP